MRVHRLDAIRGVLALGVMLYHVGLAPGIFGTYGVYAFFMLSGFALEHVYHGRLDVRRFAIARVTRLAPLWVPVVLASVVLYGTMDAGRVALNLTGLFGVVQPGSTSIVTGGWSIGIEVIFYALFPLLTLFATPVLVILTILAYALRALVMPVDPLGDGWVTYTSAASFLVFFTLGMTLARVGDTNSWQGRRAKAASILGDMSYGVYLLHPLVWVMSGSIIITVLVTPALALFVNAAYEVPAGRWMRSVHLRRVREQPAVQTTG